MERKERGQEQSLLEIVEKKLVDQIINLPPTLKEKVIERSLQSIREEITSQLKKQWEREMYETVKRQVGCFFNNMEGGYIPTHKDFKMQTCFDLAQQLYDMKEICPYHQNERMKIDYIDYGDSDSDNENYY